MFKPQNKQANVTVITDEALLAKIRNMSNEITNFLCRKAMFERAKQDLKNRTQLGNVAFWFQIHPTDGSTVLCYDKHPAQWDVDAIYKDITDREHMFYVSEGLTFWDGRMMG